MFVNLLSLQGGVTEYHQALAHFTLIYFMILSIYLPESVQILYLSCVFHQSTVKAMMEAQEKVTVQCSLSDAVLPSPPDQYSEMSGLSTLAVIYPHITNISSHGQPEKPYFCNISGQRKKKVYSTNQEK